MVNFIFCEVFMHLIHVYSEVLQLQQTLSISTTLYPEYPLFLVSNRNRSSLVIYVELMFFSLFLEHLEHLEPLEHLEISNISNKYVGSLQVCFSLSRTFSSQGFFTLQNRTKTLDLSNSNVTFNVNMNKKKKNLRSQSRV